MYFKLKLCCITVFQLLLLNSIADGQSIRLVGGNTPNEGRIEVLKGSTWGTVCDDGAGDDFGGGGKEEARVACRQLGYDDGDPLYAYRGQIPQGTLPIVMDDVRCSGNEMLLQDCSHITSHNCGHIEDFGARCYANSTAVTSTITAAAIFTTTAPITTTPDLRTTAVPYGHVAFSAARSTSQDITDNRIYFTNSYVNDGGYFNIGTSTFTAPYTGLYWLTMSVGVDSNNQADAYMTGSERVSNVMRGVSVAGYDIVSRDEIFELNQECSQVKMWSSFRVFSDNYLQTSFAGFSLSSVTDSSPVAFSFIRSTSYSCPLSGRVPFDVVIIDEGKGWDSAISEYVAPQSGIYVFSLSVGSASGSQLGVGLYKYGAMISSIQQASTDHSYESLSKTSVVQVTAGEHVYAACYLYDYSQLYSEAKAQTKLTGFLYSPQSFQPIAWSAANNQDVRGPVDYVPFPILISSVGGGWMNNNQFVAPQSGVYYINIATGVNTGFMTRMDLLINGNPIINVYRSANDHNGIRTRSRSLVYRLNSGDQLRIQVSSGYQLYSADNRLTTFSGFLVYPY